MAEALSLSLPGAAARSRADHLGGARAFCAAAVVVVHASYAPASPAFARMGVGAGRFDALLNALAIGFPVDTFLFLSFLLLAPKLAGGAGYFATLRARLGR